MWQFDTCLAQQTSPSWSSHQESVSDRLQRQKTGTTFKPHPPPHTHTFLDIIMIFILFHDTRNVTITNLAKVVRLLLVDLVAPTGGINIEMAKSFHFLQYCILKCKENFIFHLRCQVAPLPEKSQIDFFLFLMWAIP